MRGWGRPGAGWADGGEGERENAGRDEKGDKGNFSAPAAGNCFYGVLILLFNNFDIKH